MISDPKLFCQIALQYKLVTADRLTECVRLAGQRRVPIGDVLREKGYITDEQLAWLVHAESYYVQQQQAQQQGAQPQRPAGASTTATAPAQPRARTMPPDAAGAAARSPTIPPGAAATPRSSTIPPGAAAAPRSPTQPAVAAARPGATPSAAGARPAAAGTGAHPAVRPGTPNLDEPSDLIALDLPSSPSRSPQADWRMGHAGPATASAASPKAAPPAGPARPRPAPSVPDEIPLTSLAEEAALALEAFSKPRPASPAKPGAPTTGSTPGAPTPVAPAPIGIKPAPLGPAKGAGGPARNAVWVSMPTSAEELAAATPVAAAPKKVTTDDGIYPPMFQPQLPPDAGKVERLLAEGLRRRASDIHFHATLPPLLRIDGVMSPFPGEAAITPEESEALVRGVLDERQRAIFAERNDLDFAFERAGLGRFRSNAYRQQRGCDVVFRAVPLEPPTLADLGMPDIVEKFMSYHQGLVLCTGPAGCGKSTTMAALLDIVNRDRRDHILTIEDPIEFVHRNKKCLVRQRQVVSHTESFARALRAALREDPDVIGIGELRDLETIQLAMSAAETGHLVVGTLHTNNAIRTINRILDVFPPQQQAQMRVMFSESLRGVISQKLVRKADGKGRVAAVEVLINNHAVANLIREEKQFQIRSVMQMGRVHGQRLLDDSLKELVMNGVIKKEDAKAAADNPDSFA